MTGLKTSPRRWFDSICKENGLHLSNQQIDLMSSYVGLLLEWNKKVNLISRKDEENIWKNHVLHCATLLFKLTIPSNAKVIDIGTGGGLPGIPLKILQPDLRITLIDATKKRIEAVKEMLNRLSFSDVSAYWGRAEDLGKKPGFAKSFDIAVARAVAPLKNLVSWSNRLLIEQPSNISKSVERKDRFFKIAVNPPVLIAMKGGNLEGEINQINRNRSVKNLRVIELVVYESEQVFMNDKKALCVQF